MRVDGRLTPPSGPATPATGSARSPEEPKMRHFRFRSRSSARRTASGRGRGVTATVRADSFRGSGSTRPAKIYSLGRPVGAGSGHAEVEESEEANRVNVDPRAHPSIKIGEIRICL